MEQYHKSHARNYINYNTYEKTNAILSPLAQFLASWAGKPQLVDNIKLQYIVELLYHLKYPTSVGPLRNMVRGVLESYQMKFCQVRELATKYGICASNFKHYIQCTHGQGIKDVLYHEKKKKQKL